MKIWLFNHPGLCFSTFALLIAARDTFTHLLLDRSVDPILMLFVFFLITLFSSFTYSYFFKSGSLKDSESMKEKISLGLITCFAFIATIYGISLLGASVFSLIEHCLIPITTLIFSYKYLKEKVTGSMVFGIFVSVLALAVFLIASQNVEATGVSSSSWTIGVFLAIFSSLLTTVSSGFQKKLITSGLRPDEVLVIRFSIPTLMLAGLLFITRPELPDLRTVFILCFIGFFFFTLPLILLLQGFLRASLGRFSVFNILVPAFTFLISSFLIEGEIEKWQKPGVGLGILGITIGYFIFELKTLNNFFSKTRNNNV